MAPNILVTGAAGLIGGSVVTDLARRDSFGQLFALVRSDEQVASFSSVVGVTVVKGDLGSREEIIDIIVKNKIGMIINCATCIEKEVILTLIKGLAKHKEVSGEKTYLVHTSGTSAFDQITGWPLDETSDQDDLFELEKQTASTYILRECDVFTTEQSEAHGIESVIIMPVNIHGRGFGPWNQLSIHFPGQIKTSIKQRKVHRFSEDRIMPLVHIADLTEYYARLTEALIQGRQIPTGKKGYYVVISHKTSWRDALSALATALKVRGLIDDDEVGVWASDDEAAKAFDMPIGFTKGIYNSGSNVVSKNAVLFGWEPKWTRERFLEKIDDEVRDTLELDGSRTSLLRAIEKEKKRASS